MKTLIRAALCAPLVVSSTSAFSQDILKSLGLTYGGYLDSYYQYDFGRPGNGDTVNGRGFDIAHNRSNLVFAEFDLSRPTTAKSPFGFTLALYAGRGPEIIHLTEPGGRNKYRYVRQAYVTYASPTSSAVTVDIGKFDTWIGYEGIDNRYQDEYGRSFNWTYSEPTYETGIRVNGKITPKLNGALYLVQGWNEVEDGNAGKSLGATLSYSPDSNTTFLLQDHYGVEGSNDPNDVGSYGGIGFPNPGTATVHLLDFVASRQVTPMTKVAFNLDYASAKGATNDGNWNGEVLYFRRQINQGQAASLRLDRMEDSAGLRVGMPITLESITGTYDRTLAKNATLRFEVRHDIASAAFFNSDSGPKKHRTTVMAAAILRF